MLRLLIPLLLLLMGTGGGIAAGVILTGAPEGGTAEDHGEGGHGEDDHGEEAHGDDGHGEGDGAFEYVRLNNQFVVPVVSANRVEALVVMSLSLEVTSGSQVRVYDLEPKLRDAFLQVMFDHANLGGFDGIFTSSDNMSRLRSALLTAARGILGSDVSNILIFDLVRQDS